MTIIRELGYQYEQNSVVYSTSNSSEAWLFHYPLKSAFFEKKEGAGYKPYKRGQKIKIANHINIDQN
ncbi:hypothetical protein JT089_01370 [Helicobacter pylori]|nr:hypothetical protein [Helicobacter pylori]